MASKKNLKINLVNTNIKTFCERVEKNQDNK